jgi:hypothetical protein
MANKALIFDAGPIISLSINNLLWILPELKQRFGGEFYIAEAVRAELVANPLRGKRFKFEAMQVESLIETGVLKIIDDRVVKRKADELKELANKAFYLHKYPMQVVQEGEMETIAAAITMGIDTAVVDERVTRMLVEKPEQLERILEKKMHADVTVDHEKLHTFNETTKRIQIIRSIELAAVAFEHGLLNKYLVEIPNARMELLDSILWAIKLNGCSVTEEEINEIIEEESQKNQR